MNFWPVNTDEVLLNRLAENPALSMVVSDPIVMKSAAGYYVGSICAEREDDGYEMVMPYDRYSEYFNTKQAAEVRLLLEQKWENE